MRNLIVGCTVAAISALSAPSIGKPAREWMIRPPSLVVPQSQIGVASWYGPGFQGLPTASGPPFDMNAMTCAHRTLPLGTTVRVTNLLTFRSVVLKVNDRGPYIPGRVLDVSRAAAKHLGFVGAGLAPVRIEVVRYPFQRLISLSRPALIPAPAN